MMIVWGKDILLFVFPIQPIFKDILADSNMFTLMPIVEMAS